ncbi:MAG: helix-turn-helix domain-containing protein, partial [Ferruginibacter sp.]
MKQQETINYNRIAEAIDYLTQNFKEQPNLDEVAEKIHLSPFHFQRLFTEWAGVSPKKYLQYISVEHAKSILKNKQASLFDAAYETGLSGTGRLHDLFIKIEGMTPGEFKNGGENLFINYSYAESPFGNILVASTIKGICYMAFAEDEKKALEDLQQHFPQAHFKQMLDLIQQNALYIFTHDWSKLHQVKLHLRGTDFQMKVWETLLKIPMGKLSTYGNIA